MITETITRKKDFKRRLKSKLKKNKRDRAKHRAVSYTKVEFSTPAIVIKIWRTYNIGIANSGLNIETISSGNSVVLQFLA